MRLIVPLLALWWLVPALPAQDTRTPNPLYALVRFKSHGGSGVVIKTQQGRSWILTCAHMFQGRMARARIVTDGPPQPFAQQTTAAARLIKVDPSRDLALVILDNGPFYYVPIAPAGYVPRKRLLSAGYDNLRWPVTSKGATLLGSSGRTTYTVEKPWHGRSGGGLFDVDAGYLVGIVSGYEAAPPRYNRGLYVSLTAIHHFMGTPNPRAPPGLRVEIGGGNC